MITNSDFFLGVGFEPDQYQGSPQALEILENLEITKKVPCMEKSWNLKKTW